MGQNYCKSHADFDGMTGNAIPNRTIRYPFLYLEEIYIDGNTGSGGIGEKFAALHQCLCRVFHKERVIQTIST